MPACEIGRVHLCFAVSASCQVVKLEDLDLVRFFSVYGVCWHGCLRPSCSVESNSKEIVGLFRSDEFFDLNGMLI